MATQDQANRTLRFYQDQIMSNANVGYMAVVPDTLPPDPAATDGFHIKVGVYDLEKHEAARSGQHAGANEGYSTFVPDSLPVPDDGSEPAAGARIDIKVALTGKIRALSFKKTLRPAAGGDSTSLDELGAGTLGASVTVNGQEGFFLTNWHIAHGDIGKKGAPELQRAFGDGGRVSGDQIGTLFWWALTSLVDAALVKATQPNMLRFALRCLGVRIAGNRPAAVGMPVWKCGRTTEKTTGTIQSVNATVWVSGYPGGPRRFADQIQTKRRMLDEGDSGAMLLDDSNHAVGLCFAGSDTESYANKIEHVQDAASTGGSVNLDGRVVKGEPIVIGWTEVANPD